MLRPRVHREHAGAGPHGAAGCLDPHRVTDAEPRHRRVLVDAHPGVEDGVAERSGQTRGLHGGAEVAHEAAAHDGGVDPSASLIPGEYADVLGEAQPVVDDHVVGPRAQLRVGGRERQLTVGSEPCVDAPVVAERADRADALLAHLAEPPSLMVAVALGEVGQLAPERVHEAAVAPARPAAADVLLQQHDLCTWRELPQEPRGPHPRVAPAHDHHVGFRLPLQRGSGRSLEDGIGERFAQPPGAAVIGWDGDGFGHASGVNVVPG